MTGITTQQAQEHLDLWLAADMAVTKGQAYSIGSRSLTRANAKEIRDSITFWDKRVRDLSRGGIRITLGVPFD